MKYNIHSEQFTLRLAGVAVVSGIVLIMMLLVMLGACAQLIYTTDTSDWFAPSGKTTLEASTSDYQTTSNPQLTIDGKTLQGGE